MNWWQLEMKLLWSVRYFFSNNPEVEEQCSIQFPEIKAAVSVECLFKCQAL
jgi:hypothetical protein